MTTKGNIPEMVLYERYRQTGNPQYTSGEILNELTDMFGN